MNITNVSLLCSVSITLTIILSIIMLAVGVGVGVGTYAAVIIKKKKSSKSNADKIIEDAYTQAEQIKKDAEKIKTEQVKQTKKSIC